MQRLPQAGQRPWQWLIGDAKATEGGGSGLGSGLIGDADATEVCIGLPWNRAGDGKGGAGYQNGNKSGSTKFRDIHGHNDNLPVENL